LFSNKRDSDTSARKKEWEDNAYFGPRFNKIGVKD
jgi:hypothetical protein